MAKPRDYGLFKRVGRNWVREYPEMAFKKAKAERVFASHVRILPDRAVRMVPNGKA